MKRTVAMASALTLLVAACSGAAVTTTLGPTAPATGAADSSAAEETYWVELSNLLAGAANLQERCVEDATAATEIDVQTLFSDCVLTPFENDTEVIAGLAAPEGAATEHDDYLAARRTWIEAATEALAQAGPDGDFTAAVQQPAFATADNALSGTCRTLEQAAASAGIDVSLSCPAVAAPPSTDIVDASLNLDGWYVEPAGAIDTGGGVILAITNGIGTDFRPVVAQAMEGEPVPIGDPLQTLSPGERMTLEIGPGSYVIFTDEPGAYETGAYGRLIIVSTSDLQATYMEPALAAQSCAELSDVIVDLFQVYMDEVESLTAQEFLASPLSMADDLRFGGVGMRMQQLGCGGAQLDAAVQTGVCQITEPEGSARAAILERSCDG